MLIFAGKRIQFGPSSWLRGQSPAPAKAAWFRTTAPSAQGHVRGRAKIVAAAAACTAAEPYSNGAGAQRLGKLHGCFM
jgi:hypothetical protein